MQLGMIGVGRMGGSMVLRLIRGGHQVILYSARRGSVVASWLLDLTATVLLEDPALSNLTGRVSDSGEGRWTNIAAIEEGAPAPVLSTALYQRFSSRNEDDFARKILSAMRYKFGGHVEKVTKD